MSELIHKKDRGVMIPIKIKDVIKCSKCGFKVQKLRYAKNMSKVFWKYQYKTNFNHYLMLWSYILPILW